MEEIAMQNQGALSGVTVLDLSRLLPGPYCSMILADHGARVIGIEDKRFIDDDLFLTTVQRNKEHMALNLKSEEGKAIFYKLVKKADVVLEGFRPGVVNRLGVDYETVRRHNPGIVYCAITGFGQNGPLRDHVGHDVNYLAYSGVLDLIGEPGRPPSIPGIQVADIAAGGMNAATGILLALYAREKTGKGQYIDISMTDGMTGFLAAQFYFLQRSGEFPKRGDMILSHRYACYNTYETADSRYISIGAVEYRFWKQFCEILDLPEYIPCQYDDTRRTEIVESVRGIFRQKTLAEWEEIFADSDTCWAPVRSLEEVLDEPLFRERQMVTAVETPDGSKSIALGVSIKLSDTPGSIRTPPVSFGENSGDILGEIGYTAEEIRSLEEKGVI